MRHFIYLFVLLLVGCQPLTPMGQGRLLHAVGYATISDQQGKTAEERQLRAMRASKLDAYRELTEQVYGLRINARSELDEFALEDESTMAAADGIIRGAEVLKSYRVGDSYVTEMQLDLRVMEQMKEHGEAIHVPAQQQTLF
ncbi:LPP20 family lipoprotein [Vibrio stylophorae]|nr:flagellar biosynthesis protein FlgP [Vibrio stylophorae]